MKNVRALDLDDSVGPVPPEGPEAGALRAEINTAYTIMREHIDGVDAIVTPDMRQGKEAARVYAFLLFWNKEMIEAMPTAYRSSALLTVDHARELRKQMNDRAEEIGIKTKENEHGHGHRWLGG